MATNEETSKNSSEQEQKTKLNKVLKEMSLIRQMVFGFFAGSTFVASFISIGIGTTAINPDIAYLCGMAIVIFGWLCIWLITKM